MDNNILISVIIPAYNAEKFLDRAVQSVLGQMDGRFELILVNDGSVDGTGDMCDAYAQNHENIVVMHKANDGISSARNAGIEVARGEYLMFLDADDYLEADACAEVRRVIREYHPDCIDFGWRYITNGNAMPPAFHKLPKNELLDENVIRELILPPLLNLRNDPDHFIFDFSCTKVFRNDIPKTNGVEFDESRRIWEDRPFVARYLKYCDSYYAIDRCFYNYVDTPASLSRKYSMDFFRIILENFQLYKQLYGDTYDFDTEYVNTYWCRSIENMIYRSLEQTENQKQIRQNILDVLQNEQVVHWYKNRTTTDRFEKMVSRYIASGETERVLRAYANRVGVNQIKQRYSHLKGFIRRAMKRIISQ